MRRKQKIRQWLMLVVSCYLIVGCGMQREEELFSKSKENQFNELDTRRTEFSYRGNDIYSVSIPYPFLHSSFLWSNFLIVDKEKVHQISLNPNCKEKYINGNYEIIQLLNRDSEGDVALDPCNIVIVPFVDFSLNTNDTISYDKNHMLVLSRKFFDKEINDTVYLFTRKWGETESTTKILISKKYGILGVYELFIENNKEFVQNAIGRTYQREPTLRGYKLQRPSIDLNVIEEFR